MMNETMCKICDPGRYQNEQGANTTEGCKNCPAGFATFSVGDAGK